MTRLNNALGLAAVLAIGLVVLLFFEWHTDEPLVVLPILLTACFAGGLLAPRFWLCAGIVLGWAILVAHALSNSTGVLIPLYQHRPATSGDYIAMTLLVLPAVASALAGSRVWKHVRIDLA